MLIILVPIVFILTLITPIIAPENEEIAFISNRDGRQRFYLLTMPHGLVTPLSTSEDLPEPIDFDWSPDGTRIAFTARPRSNQEIFVLNLITDTVTNITNFIQADDFNPSWSPDGEQIAFASRRGGSVDLYRMNADGSNLTPLTNDPFFDQMPDWSSDGQHIIYSSFRPAQQGQQQGQGLYLLDLNSLEQTVLQGVIQYVDYYPVWSPNDHRIAFSSIRSGIMSLYTYDLQTTTLIRHTSDTPAHHPDWGVDGTRVIFSQLDGSSFNLYSIDADGTNFQRISTSPFDDIYPSVRPIRD